MRKPQTAPETQSVEITDVSAHISSLVDEIAQKQTRVLVEQSGRPVAALVSLEDYRQLARMDAQHADDLRVVSEIQELFSDVPPDELEREISQAVAEVRAEMKAEREAARRA